MRREELANAVNALVERSMPVDVPGDAEYIAATVAACRRRFLITGEKYVISETEQSFERSTVGTMAKGMREELQDGVNYAVMLDILRERDDVKDFEARELSPGQSERLRMFCETTTCLLVDFDRELQELLAELGYADDGADYVETLANEVNAGDGGDWKAEESPFVVYETRMLRSGEHSSLPIMLGAGANATAFFAVKEAEASVALDGETQSALDHPDVRAALVGGLQEETIFGVSDEDGYEVEGEPIDVPVTRRTGDDNGVAVDRMQDDGGTAPDVGD